jgi:hypothetical protein
MDIEPGTSWKVYVNSLQKLSGTDSNFAYNINPPANIKFDRVVVLDALIKKSYYGVSQGANTFTLQEGNQQVVVTVAVGNYNFVSWQYYISTLLTSVSPNGYTYNVSYPNTTQSADTGKWVFTIAGPVLANQPSFIFDNSNSNVIYESFGFQNGSTNTFVNNQLVSTVVADLGVEDSLFIKSDIVEGTPNQPNVLQTIKVASSPNFSSITYLCPAPQFYAQPVSNNLKATANFSITDEHDNIIDLNGQNVTFTLLFYQENTVWRKLKTFMGFVLSIFGAKVGI